MKHSDEQFEKSKPSSGKYGSTGDPAAEKPWHDRDCASDANELREYNELQDEEKRD